MDKHRVYKMSFASVYPHYVQKAERKGRKKNEVDEVICWLTGYSPRKSQRAATRRLPGVDDCVRVRARYGASL